MKYEVATQVPAVFVYMNRATLDTFGMDNFQPARPAFFTVSTCLDHQRCLCSEIIGRLVWNWPLADDFEFVEGFGISAIECLNIEGHIRSYCSNKRVPQRH